MLQEPLLVACRGTELLVTGWDIGYMCLRNKPSKCACIVAVPLLCWHCISCPFCMSNRWSQSKADYHYGIKINIAICAQTFVIQYTITAYCSSYEVVGRSGVVNYHAISSLPIATFVLPWVLPHIAHEASKLTVPSTAQECTLASRPWIEGHMTPFCSVTHAYVYSLPAWFRASHIQLLTSCNWCMKAMFVFWVLCNRK